MPHIGQLHRDILSHLSEQTHATVGLIGLARHLVDRHPDTTLHEIIAVIRLIIQTDPSLRPVAVRILGEQSFMLRRSAVSAA